MADDERQAEIEAAFDTLDRVLKEIRSHARDSWRSGYVDLASEGLAALDRVRDARDDDEAPPYPGPRRWITCPECGSTDEASDTPCSNLACPSHDRRGNVEALRERAEAGIEAMGEVWVKLGNRDGLFGCVGLLDEASRRALIERYLSRVSSSRDGSVAVEDVDAFRLSDAIYDQLKRPGAMIGGFDKMTLQHAVIAAMNRVRDARGDDTAQFWLRKAQEAEAELARASAALDEAQQRADDLADRLEMTTRPPLEAARPPQGEDHEVRCICGRQTYCREGGPLPGEPSCKRGTSRPQSEDHGREVL